MSIKTEWRYYDINECWEFEQGEYLLQVFKDEGKPWQWRCLKDHRFCIETGKPALSLSTAKRMATKWLQQHCQPAPTDEAQEDTSRLAPRLVAYTAMEGRLMLAIAEARAANETALAELLMGILHGEVVE